MNRNVSKMFGQILVRSMDKSTFIKEYETGGFFEALEAAGKDLQRNPGNADFTLIYRKQIITIRSLIITALIEALDSLDRKIENLEGINALLENIALARRIQNEKDLIKVVHQVLDDFNKYGIGSDCGKNEI